uniref:NR LBD domain-containing protein n=1 Tax=Panagrolaimus davidi TaxID=227884 RepID=A0A914QQJ5_9BILA
MKKGVVLGLKRIKPTEIEFCVMCLHLMFLHPGIQNITDETVEIGNFWRQQAFQELHEHYTRELFLTNYAGRLGEFMSLMSMIEKNSIQKRENYRIAEVFSLIKLSPLLMTFYRDS